MSSDNKKRIQVTVLKQAPVLTSTQVQTKRQGKAKSALIPSVCGGTQTQKGFSAVYSPDDPDAVLPSGTMINWWKSAPTTPAPGENDYYGSFNDGHFDDISGRYIVPTTGQYSIAVNLILTLVNDPILGVSGDAISMFNVVVSSTIGGLDQAIVGTALTETVLQNLTITDGTVTANTVDKIASVAIQRAVQLTAGDVVRLDALMGKPWHLAAYYPTPNTFSITKTG